MPALREALVAAGFDNVRTHLNSGNVIVVSASPRRQWAGPYTT